MAEEIWKVFTRYDEYWLGRVEQSPIFNELLSPKKDNPSSGKQKGSPGSGTPSPGDGNGKGTGKAKGDGQGNGKGSGDGDKSPGTGDGEVPAQFANAVKELTKIPGLQKLTKNDPEMSEEVTKQIRDFMGKASKYIANKKNDPFKNEKEILERFKKVTPKTYPDNWKETGPFLEETYEAKELDAKFYAGQFEKSLQPLSNTKLKKAKSAPKKILFPSVKKNLVEKWEKLLAEKDKAFEELVIDEFKEQLKADIQSKLGKLDSLMEMLAPFELSSSQLFKLGKAEWRKSNLDIVKKFAELLAKDKSLQELADLMGRASQAEKEQERETYMKTVIIPEYKPVHAGKSEIMGVRESDDIANLLSSEMLLLCDESLELLFYKQFIEKKLQTYEYQGKYMSARIEETPDVRIKEVDGIRGPYILCVDTSGSMSGNPEVVCKVLAFALTKRALAEKRKCYMISFSNEIQTLDLTNMNNSLQALLNFLGSSFNGGTDVEPAIEEAVRKIESEQAFKKADVLMLSDFETDNLSEELIARMNRAKQNKTKFNSLVIKGDWSGGGGGYNESVLQVFDNVWNYDPANQQEVIKISQQINPPKHTLWGARPILFSNP